MIRFFLHIHSPYGREPDEEGQEHPSLAAARVAAIRGLREIVSHGIRDGEFRMDEWIEIENERSELLDRVRFRDVLNGPPPEELPLNRDSRLRRKGANDR